jgi:hypothetical protein
MSNSERRIAASATTVSDFDPRCECGQAAVMFLELHNVDYCTQTRRTVSALVCKPCSFRDMARVQELLLDGPDFCSSCGLTIVSLSDMVVRLSPL